MPFLLKKNDVNFPPASEADEFGILAIGGDFSKERLLSAYRSGIFPWPHEGFPILWFCPDPRFVLKPKDVIINQTLAKVIKRTALEIKADFNFLSVMKHCQDARRKDQDGTWITDEMISGYGELHRHGYAHSIEAYDQGELVGGLYGVAMGTIFFGESMFFKKPNASKICFITLVAHLLSWGYRLIDCQAYTKHLEKFGALAISRSQFLKVIEANQAKTSTIGPWQLHLTPKDAHLFIDMHRTVKS